MDLEFNSSSSWDIFFFYGKNDLDLESQYDLYEMLLQPKRSLYFFRRGSAGVNEYINNPNGIDLQVFARFEIANAIAYRNTIVSRGENGTRDRRIAVSQTSIGFESKDDELNVKILYFLFENYETPKSNSFPLIK